MSRNNELCVTEHLTSESLQKIWQADIVSSQESAAELTFTAVNTDSRTVGAGEVFIPLTGESHNGHDYVVAAIEAGASAVCIHEWRPEWVPFQKKINFYKVEDTLKALQDLASFVRRSWGGQVVGVTGSNGKTTVKEFCWQILSQKFSTLKSKGSFNNHWGVPLTLLELRRDHRVAVIEMGMNHMGEISDLCEIAEPNTVLVNNVGRAHMGPMGSLENVAKAKSEIYQNHPENKTALFNLENPWTAKMYEDYKECFKSTYTFGNRESDIFIESPDKSIILHTDGESYSVNTESNSLTETHNLQNLMAAVGVAKSLGMTAPEITKAIPLCQPAWGRQQWLQLPSGQRVLFDAYNANPDSYKALLDSLEGTEQQILVCGEMLEQGESTKALHKELAEKVAKVGSDKGMFRKVFYIGESAEIFKESYLDAGKSEDSLVISSTYDDSLALEIKSMLELDTQVVIKGSRGLRLERLVVALGLEGFKKTE